MRGHNARGKLSCRSTSSAMGAISASAKRATASRISSASSPRPKSKSGVAFIAVPLALRGIAARRHSANLRMPHWPCMGYDGYSFQTPSISATCLARRPLSLKNFENLPWPAGAVPAAAYADEARRQAVLDAYGTDLLEDDPELMALTKFAAD